MIGFKIFEETILVYVLKDEEGVQIMRVIEKNIAHVLKLVENRKDSVNQLEMEREIFANFIK